VRWEDARSRCRTFLAGSTRREAGTLPRCCGKHEAARRRHRIRRRRDRAWPARVARGDYRNQARRDTCGHSMASGVAAPSAVEVDAAIGPRDDPRHGRATHAVEPVVPAARCRVSGGNPEATFRPAARCLVQGCAATHFPDGVAFEIDGRDLTPSSTSGAERVPIAIRIGRRRTLSIVGFVERRVAVPPNREGVAISTFGKVIKRGWEWLGLAPAVHRRISGLLQRRPSRVYARRCVAVAGLSHRCRGGARPGTPDCRRE
jgi:hypothetical protein